MNIGGYTLAVEEGAEFAWRERMSSGGYTLAVEEAHFVRRRVVSLWRRGRIPSGGYTLAVEEAHFVRRREEGGTLAVEEGAELSWRGYISSGGGGGTFIVEEGAEFSWRKVLSLWRSLCSLRVLCSRGWLWLLWMKDSLSQRRGCDKPRPPSTKNLRMRNNVECARLHRTLNLTKKLLRQYTYTSYA